MRADFEEEIMKQPFIQELSMMLGDNVVKIPYIEKNKILMSPGTWNGYFYSKEEIRNGFKNTNWEERANKNLFLDHGDNKAGEWVGEITNQMVDESGVLTGDLVIYDPVTATKLSYGKPKMGISPKVRGDSDGRAMKNFAYENFSIVINPAVKTAWINNSDGSNINYLNQSNEVKTMAGGEEKKMDEKSQMAAKVETNPAVQEPKQELEKEQAGGSEIDAFVKFYTEYKAKKPEASFGEIADSFGGDKGEKAPEAPEAEAEMKMKNPVKNPEEVEKMRDSEVKEMKETIKTLSEQVSELNKKLDAPERVTSKGSTIQELGSKEDSDVSFMKYLKGSNL